MGAKTMKRYTLSLPTKTHEELINVANSNGVSVRDIMLKSIKLGLLAIQLDSEIDKELIIKESTSSGITETKLLLI